MPRKSRHLPEEAVRLPRKALRLAPLYDLVSTLVYGDDRLAMHIDNVRRTDKVTTDRIVNEADRWGMSKRRAAEIVDDLLNRVPDAAKAARQETEGLPLNISKVAAAQLKQLRGVAGGAERVSNVTVS